MSKLIILLVSVFSLIFPAEQAHSFYVTQESSCSSIDLRTDFPLKMRNQGDISWCYAHAAADYLQFINRIPVQISAADIALNYNHRQWPRLLNWFRKGMIPETGFIRGAIYDISLIGYCPEEYFPSELWNKRIVSGIHSGELIQVPLNIAIEDILSIVSNIQNGMYLHPTDLSYVYEFKGTTHEQFFNAVFNFSQKNVLDELRSVACNSHRTLFPNVITSIEMNFKRKSSFAQINKILDERKPLTIDFFYGFLENTIQYRKKISELHTTVLVGRRYDSESQECKYLIKNSYGTDCTHYDRSHVCEDGYLWVSESALYSAMTSYEYISSSYKKITETAEQIQDEQSSQ